LAELLTPADVRRLLAEHGLAPRKSAGQNFVCDPNTVRMIVRGARLEPDDTVVEIGPGLGSLTLALAEAADSVHAIEIDAGFVSVLRDEVLADLANVTVHHADAMEVDLDALPGEGPLRVVANLPYNVATPLVVHALEHDRVADLYVMVQREVGERWCAAVGDPLYAGISVKLQVVAEADLDVRISRQVFHPVPNVDSVMVRIVRRPDGLTGARRRRVVAVVDAAFAQRRKTLRNTLRPLAPRETLASALEAAGVDAGSRPEELAPDAFVRLADALADVLADPGAG
jgi:16S rRNA (adenine1518-N6/adenine1519-N6)-dimethyltransferase